MEAFLQGLMNRLLPPACTFQIHRFQGKRDLLAQLESRLKGYASWLPSDSRLVVLVDRDDDDCRALKQHLEDTSSRAKLLSRSRSSSSSWQIVNRIVIEELEAWYFGDWDAVHAAFSKVPKGVVKKPRYRDPDAIRGGTSEAFERILQRYGYFKAGIRKIEVARTLGTRGDPSRCCSRSFVCFRDALLEAFRCGEPAK